MITQTAIFAALRARFGGAFGAWLLVSEAIVCSLICFCLPLVAVVIFITRVQRNSKRNLRR